MWANIGQGQAQGCEDTFALNILTLLWLFKNW